MDTRGDALSNVELLGKGETTILVLALASHAGSLKE